MRCFYQVKNQSNIPDESESDGNVTTDFTSESNKFACLVKRLHNVTRQQIKIMLGE